MGPEPGPFYEFYQAALHHPWLLWAGAAAGAAACLRRRGLDPSLRRYALGLVALSAVDAWLTSSHVYGVGHLEGRAASLVPLFFVLAGDFRYWLLLTAAGPDGRFAPGPSSLLAAAALTLPVPLFTQGLLAALPGDEPPRMMFLIYEVAFAILVLGLMARLPALRGGWLRSFSRFVLLYYWLWALADVWILATGADAGYLLRVVPNLLYYGGFMAAVAWLAPDRGPQREAS